MVGVMPGQPGTRVTVVTLNTRGVPVIGFRLAGRYAVIGSAIEAGDADVVCFQEVFSRWHLRLLAARMRSFRHVSYRASPAGPAGGLVTFSRLPVSGAGRFYPLHRAQLDVLAQVVRGVPAPAVVCGDFNVDRDSCLFGGFLAGTGLAGAFDGDCPATLATGSVPKPPACSSPIRSRCRTARAMSQTTWGCVPTWS